MYIQLSYIITWYVVFFTCNEFKIVKSHANTSVFRFTANNPRTQVSPSRGRRMTDDFNIVLEEEKYACSLQDVNILYQLCTLTQLLSLTQQGV